MRHRVVALAAGLVLLTGCTGAEDDSGDPRPEPPGRTAATHDASGSATPEPTSEPPARFDAAAVLRDIRHLSLRIGPREATSARFREAVAFVSDRLRGLGYEVRRTRVPVPAGDSWGVPVGAGTSYNLIADPPGFDPNGPHRIVGAHLDTVAVSPGAEDNGSGVSVLLELARLTAGRPPAVPVRFIAFGAEEPRGEGESLHHFGSRRYVRELPSGQRRALDAMVALDRVGVYAPAVPVCFGGSGTTGVRQELLRAARTAGVPAAPCEDRASDHWSFERAGLPAARIGSVPYAGYHSAADRPGMVDRRELHRVGRLMWRWLAPPQDLGP